MRRTCALTTLVAALTVGPAAYGQRATPAPAAAAVSPAGRAWVGPEGRPLPFRTDEEVLDFLRTAKIKGAKSIPVGTTDPQKVLLEKGGVRAYAHFNYVNEEKAVANMADGRREMNFRDSYKFQGAAYELARLLGLDNVPPTVERHVGGREGSLSIWIEGSMSDKERRKQNLEPPVPRAWINQMRVMYIFDALIYNIDRNQGNILIDGEWKIWMIDHTRAFRRRNEPKDLNVVLRCDWKLFQKLKQLDGEEVRARLKPYLRGYEIDALLKRHAAIVAHIEDLIQRRGEAEVLYSRP
jgi:hypothetical protein